MRTVTAQNIIHRKTGLTYRIHAADQLEFSQSHYEDIARICNQPDVYMLFGDRWKGEPYSLQNAKDFISWAQEGWRKSEYFIFLVTTINGSISAALDIKSAQLESAEIGYWCDEAHRGITGAAVQVMVAWAKMVGFQELAARPINERSTQLLQRLDFALDVADATSEPMRWTLSLE